VVTAGDALPFDARELRHVLGTFVTGVTVITTLDKSGAPVGITANSFSSVSLDPPLILWSQALAAPSHRTYRDCDRFAINILSEDQIDIANRFAKPSVNKFEDVVLHSQAGEVPLIAGCAAYLLCHLVARYPGGDHAVFIGEVETVKRTSLRPLVFGKGRYLMAQPNALGAPLRDGDQARLNHLRAVRIATQALIHLREELDETLALGVWGNRGPTLVRWEEGSQPVTANLQIGHVLPITRSATGIAFAAWLPEAEVEPFLVEEITCMADRQHLDAARDQARREGCVRLVASHQFASQYGGAIDAFSAPVFDQTGRVLLVITALRSPGTISRDNDARIIEACNQLSAQLGHSAGASS